MCIRNNSGFWKRLQHFYPELMAFAEIIGVLMMMLVLCVEF